MTRRGLKRLLLVAVALPLLVRAVDRFSVLLWCGSTNLEVEFVITDGATGAPVPRACVAIHQEKGGFYEDKDEKEFLLVAGDDGRISKECPGSFCSGAKSTLGLSDTFKVYPPGWVVQVGADGYESSDNIIVNLPENYDKSRRSGDRKAKLIIPVALHKK
ncbi:Uncharacterized protein OS=Planctomyces limnophilus (strain ATCC 43296 / DSM 3776 / IFAM 1008 / 290) GN=Plim_3710 PE=4 SV=1 [Gemmata massiliana]|uniref:Uncharacterized protein n=1 Tax=Gemmata massiliana TaxID=1210884 RepID=A0A6P2D5R1_9BACT|nr:hypothetical protein [Gemmata massiliana]VTR94760.1 Uncharacterized protein OS=Planctomyces limnophilus (strain ATCC 43296 / DSM 3776 / IFAM 1008 / 290) GN=Plim_3710 PE=4 SV=1 [Gemmata massiliana]